MGGCSSKPAYDTPVPAGLTHQQQLGLLIGKKQQMLRNLIHYIIYYTLYDI